jgi:hypothetical protein
MSEVHAIVRASSSIMAEASSAIMIVGAFVFPAGDRRHDRCIDDAQPTHTVHPQPGIDHSIVLFQSHPAGTNGVRLDSALSRMLASNSARC